MSITYYEEEEALDWFPASHSMKISSQGDGKFKVLLAKKTNQAYSTKVCIAFGSSSVSCTLFQSVEDKTEPGRNLHTNRLFRNYRLSSSNHFWIYMAPSSYWLVIGSGTSIDHESIILHMRLPINHELSWMAVSNPILVSCEPLPSQNLPLQYILSHVLQRRRYNQQYPQKRLTKQIKQLPTLKTDHFGNAVSVIQEKISLASSNSITRDLKAILPSLLPPSHYLMNQKEPPFDLAQIQYISTKISTLVEHLEQVQGFNRIFLEPMEVIGQAYNEFIETFLDSSVDGQYRRIIPLAQISIIGKGYFTISQNVAGNLLSLNEKGQTVKKNSFGTHAVCRMNGVFYKPNPRGRFYIGPEREHAVYKIYEALGVDGLAPTELLKIRHVFLPCDKRDYGETVQASLGVEGILLKTLLEIAELLPFLERTTGNSEAVFYQLMDTTWEQQFLESNPHLSSDVLRVLSTEEASERVLQAYETFFEKIPQNDRCIEFNHDMRTSGIIYDFRTNIYNYHSEGVVGALALLQMFPSLAVEKGKIRKQVSFTALTDLYFTIKRLPHILPGLTTDKLYETLSDIYSYFDLYQFSGHVIASILSNPEDHKSDNFMVSVQRDERGFIKKLKIIGIDNDLAFVCEERVRTLIYLLPMMNHPIHCKMIQTLANLSPEEFILDWLIALEKLNENYNQWKKQGVLLQEDLFYEGEPRLGFPLTLNVLTVPRLYQTLSLIVDICKSSSSLTHWELLEQVQPVLAKAYQHSLNKYDNIEDMYSNVHDSLPIKLPSENTARQSIRDSAALFFQSIDYNSLSQNQLVTIYGKYLEHFPAQSHRHVLPTFMHSEEVFIQAVTNGYCSLVSRLVQINGSFTNIRTKENYTALHIAISRLDYAMMEFLLHLGVDAHEKDNSGMNIVILCALLISVAPTKVLSILKYLNNHITIQWNDYESVRSWTALHFLVHHSEPFSEVAIKTIRFVIMNGASVDVKDKLGRSPLDYAMLSDKTQMVKLLIDSSIGITFNNNIAKDYIHRNEQSFPDACQLLLRNNLHFRWELALEKLQSFHDTTGEYILTGNLLGEIKLPRTMKLFDARGDIQNTIYYGRRNVTKLQFDDCGLEIYLKQYPEMPGIEYAVNSLFDILIGHGTSKTELIRVQISNTHSYPLLLSQGISGFSLQQLLAEPHHFNKMLDRQSFSELFLASLFVNFEDAKADNFICERMGEKLRIIGIDNDHAFVPPIHKKQHNTVLVKCILYCIDAMKETIHPVARKKFLAMNAENIMREWLERLMVQNEHYKTLFPKKERLRLSKESKFGSVLPIVFPEGAMSDIYQKFQRLMIALQNPAISCMTILREVIPQIGIRYEEAMRTYSTPLERFWSISKEQYSTAIAGRYQTIVNSRQILLHLKISNAGYGSEKYSPVGALRELDDLKKEIERSESERESIRNKLRHGEVKPFKSILLHTEKEKIIDSFDFGTIVTKKTNLLSAQRKILKVILRGNYRSIRFRGCDVLDEHALKVLSQQSPQVLSVAFINCSSILWKEVSMLQQFEHLARLTIQNTPFTGALRLSQCISLRKLSVLHCQGVTEIEISKDIKYLVLKSCWALSRISSITIRSLTLQNCPKLEPWNRILNCSSDSKMEIQLQDVPLEPSTPNDAWPIVISACELPWEIQSVILPAVFHYLEFRAVHCIRNMRDSSINSANLYRALCLLFAEELASLKFEDYLDWKALLTDGYLGNFITTHCFPDLFSNNGLDLSFCRNVTDLGIIQLEASCYHWTEVNLYNCTKITDVAIKSLLANKTTVTVLNLRNCNITDASLYIIADNCSTLRSLNLRNCLSITNKGFCALVQSCKTLQDLDISCCRITTRGFILLNYLSHLSCLVMRNNPFLYDIALENLLLNSLTSIDLSYCQRISDEGLRKFVNNNLQLKEIAISVCPYVLDPELITSATHKRKLQ